MEKITNKSALTFVITNCEMPTEIKEKLEVMLASLDRKSSADRKPTPTQRENEVLKNALLEVLTTEPKRISEIQALGTAFADLSNQKMSRLLNDLVRAEKAVKVSVKGVTYFARAQRRIHC